MGRTLGNHIHLFIHSTPVYFSPFQSSPFHSTPAHFNPFHSSLMSIPIQSNSFHSYSNKFILCHATLIQSILLQSTLVHFSPVQSSPLWYTGIQSPSELVSTSSFSECCLDVASASSSSAMRVLPNSVRRPRRCAFTNGLACDSWG